VTGGDAASEPARAGAGSSTPWHFVVLVSLVALYLGWRLVQGIVWLVGIIG